MRRGACSGRRARPVRWLAALLMLATAACTPRAPGQVMDAGTAPAIDTAALADPSPNGARRAVEEYLAARVAGDYDKVYALLSVPTQAAYSKAELKEFFRTYISYSYESVGEMVSDPASPQWARFPVRNVHWNIRGEPPLTARVYWVTAHYSGGRWGVALAAPLWNKAMDLALKGDVAGLTRTADTMIAIDPWDYRGHVQKSQALLLGNEVEAAFAALNKAVEVATDEQKGYVARMGADVLFAYQAYIPAMALYRVVLQEAQKYPAWYKDGWEAEVRRNLAEGLVIIQEREEAARQAVAAQVLNPFDLRTHALVAGLLPAE